MSLPKIATLTANITCLCGAVQESGSLITVTHFPISDGLCHCLICRATTGALFAGGFSLKSIPSPTAIEACTKYAASDRCSRYHCRTCGSPVFSTHHEQNVDEWFVAMGAVDRTDDHKHEVDTFKLTYNIYCDAESCPGGGVLHRMAEVSSPAVQNVDCYPTDEGTSVKLPQSSELWTVLATEAAQTTSTVSSAQSHISQIPVSCHCGGISFTILPPTARHPTTDPKHVTRWTRSNGTKYVAKLCVCRYDRLVFGIPLPAWTYVFPECILTHTSSPINFASNFPSSKDGYFTSLPGFSTLKVYRSTPDVKRSFCGVCGATVFYEHAERPQIVNVPPGLIRAESGALAEEILHWDWEWVSWPEESQNRELLDAVTGGKIVDR